MLTGSRAAKDAAEKSEPRGGADTRSPSELNAHGMTTFMLHAQHSDDSRDSADGLSSSGRALPAIENGLAAGLSARKLSTQPEDAANEDDGAAEKAVKEPVTTEFFLIETGNRNLSLAKVVSHKSSVVSSAINNASLASLKPSVYQASRASHNKLGRTQHDHDGKSNIAAEASRMQGLSRFQQSHYTNTHSNQDIDEVLNQDRPPSQTGLAIQRRGSEMQRNHGNVIMRRSSEGRAGQLEQEQPRKGQISIRKLAAAR